MKVLVADKFEEVGLAQLRAQEFEVDYQPGLGGDGMARAIAAAHMVHGSRVT